VNWLCDVACKGSLCDVACKGSLCDVACKGSLCDVACKGSLYWSTGKEVEGSFRQAAVNSYARICFEEILKP
jgi:hypothetical protein